MEPDHLRPKALGARSATGANLLGSESGGQKEEIEIGA